MINTFTRTKYFFVIIFFVALSFAKENTYTINFKNIPMEEYIKFASKICNNNFIFEQNDLQFNVSVISEEKVDTKNVMATLIQILRIHGLILLEEENNLVIHKNPNVKQLAKIVTSKDSLDQMPPIITRIFRIKNVKLDSIANILKPMISTDALLELSTATSQLIITDITSNIKKISDLIDVIDSPQNPLEIEIYKVKDTQTEYLIELTKKILQPLVENVPFILVPNNLNQSIYIVSTPNLIEKTLSLLLSLDAPPTEGIKTLKTENVFIYKIRYQPKDYLERSLKEIAQNLTDSGFFEEGLIKSLNDFKWIKDTNSFIFTGSNDVLTKIKELLASIDEPVPKTISSIGKTSFFVYKIQNAPVNQLLSALKNMATNLKAAKNVDKNLIETLDSVKYIKETNSLFFTGDAHTLKQTQELLPSFDLDLSKHKTSPLSSQFFVYKPTNVLLDNLVHSLKEIVKNLETANLVNPAFMKTIDSMQVIESTNSLLFAGDENSIQRIQKLLTTIDTSSKTTKSSYFLYKLQTTPGNIIEEDLDDFIDNLKTQKIKNPSLINVLENIKWIKETNSLMITGNANDISEAKDIIAKYDISREKVSLGSSYFIYKPKYVSLPYIEHSLQDTASNLSKAHLGDKDFLNSINNLKIIESTHSIAFTGNPKTIEKIKELIQEIDTPSALKKPIHTEGNISYLIYDIQKASPQNLISTIKSFTNDLKKGKATDIDFLNALETIKYKPETKSLLFTGTAAALEKVEHLAQKFDTSSLTTSKGVANAYFVYKPKYLSGVALENNLKNFTDHLKFSGFENQALFNTINNMKWDTNTKSLIFSGDKSSINEIKNLLTTFDVDSKDLPKSDIIQESEDTSFLVYKLQYHKGSEINIALKQIAKELEQNKSNVKSNILNAIHSIQWIEVTNSLLCSGDKDTMVKIKELISSLDVPLKQVFIEMLVIDTTFANLLNFGLDWGGKYKHKNKFVAGLSNTAYNANGHASPFIQNLNSLSETAGSQVTGAKLPFTSGFDLGIIGDILLHKGKSFLSLGSFLEAIQHDVESTVVMTPKLLTQDSKTSTIFIGQNIPFIGSQTTINEAKQNITQNLEYRDVGTNLSLTPVLGNTDTVTLTIDLNRTSETSEDNLNKQTTVHGITTTKTSMQTTVHIPDKCFLVLSGMVTEKKDKTKTGLPCLGGLPLIGAAFSENNRSNTKSNLVIFIRPHIINSYKDMTNVTELQEDFFRQEAGSAVLESDFDEAIDFLKTYED